MNATTTKPLTARSKSGKYDILITRPHTPGSCWRIGAFQIGVDGVTPTHSATAMCEAAARATANLFYRSL